jgi:hypothetical protein
VPEQWTAESGLHPSGVPFEEGRTLVREDPIAPTQAPAPADPRR